MGMNETVAELTKFAYELNDLQHKSVIAEKKDYELIFSVIQSIKHGAIRDAGNFHIDQKPYYQLWKDIDGSYADSRSLNYNYPVIISMEELISDYVIYGNDIPQKLKTNPNPNPAKLAVAASPKVVADLIADPKPASNMHDALKELINGGMKSLKDIPQTKEQMAAMHGPKAVSQHAANMAVDKMREQIAKNFNKPKPEVTPQQVEMYKQMQDQAVKTEAAKSDIYIRSNVDKIYVSRAPSSVDGEHNGYVISIPAPGWHKSDIKITSGMANVIEINASKKHPTDWEFPSVDHDEIGGKGVKDVNYFSNEAILTEHPLSIDLTFSDKIDRKTFDFRLKDGVLTIYVVRKAVEKNEPFTYTVQ